MKTTKDHDERIANMTFASVYPHYIAKVEKKGRTVEELHQVISWLTGFKAEDLQRLIKNDVTFEQFFAEPRWRFRLDRLGPQSESEAEPD